MLFLFFFCFFCVCISSSSWWRGGGGGRGIAKSARVSGSGFDKFLSGFDSCEREGHILQKAAVKTELRPTTVTQTEHPLSEIALHSLLLFSPAPLVSWRCSALHAIARHPPPARPTMKSGAISGVPESNHLFLNLYNKDAPPYRSIDI